MKKFAIILALMLFQTQIAAVAANASNYNKKPAQKTQATKQTANKNQQVKQQENNNDYLLKYNINDLEAAPWLNGGKRKI